MDFLRSQSQAHIWFIAGLVIGCVGPLQVAAKDAPTVQPSEISIPADGGRVSFSMLGSGLGLFTEIRIVADDEDGNTEGITIGMGRAQGTRRNASIRTSEATPGNYHIELVDFRDNIVQLDMAVTVEGDGDTGQQEVNEEEEDSPNGDQLLIPDDFDRYKFAVYLNDQFVPVKNISGGQANFAMNEYTNGNSKVVSTTMVDIALRDVIIDAFYSTENRVIEEIVAQWIDGEDEPISIVVDIFAKDGSLVRSISFEEGLLVSYTPPRVDAGGDAGIAMHQLIVSPGRKQTNDSSEQRSKSESEKLSDRYFRLEWEGRLIPSAIKVSPGTVTWDLDRDERVAGDPSFANWLIDIMATSDPIVRDLRRHSARAAQSGAEPTNFSLHFLARDRTTAVRSIHAPATPVNSIPIDNRLENGGAKTVQYQLEVEHLSFDE